MAISVSSDGKCLVSASGDETVQIWPLHTEGKRGQRWIGVDGVQQKNGHRITKIHEGSAQAAGFQVDDIISSIYGTPITSDVQLRATIQAKKRGEVLLIRIKRAGKNQEISVTATVAPDEVEPLLSIWMGRDREWVAWTPQGYYACSLKGEKVIGWHVNRGVDKVANYYPAFQFRKQLYRLDVIKPLIEVGSVANAVRLADAARKQKTDAQLVANNIERFAPPKIEILSPTEGSAFSTSSVNVRARITDPNGRLIRTVRLLVNGRDTKTIEMGSKAISIGNKAIDIGSKPLHDGIWQQSATLVLGENVLTIVAVNDAGAESLPSQIKVVHRVTEEKPNVFVLDAGVSRYQEETYSLGFAAKDAVDFVNVFNE